MALFQSLLWWIGRVNALALREAGKYFPGFQSLLWWIGRVNSEPSSASWTQRPRFQSLLWWIGRVNAGEIELIDAIRKVSILVVVDWSRQPTIFRGHHGSRATFQSLLWWIGRVNKCGFPIQWTLASSFNPCCGGLVASTGFPWFLTSHRRLFQSLLWWIGRVNKAQAPVNTGTMREFQSLLWWIGRVNESIRIAAIAAAPHVSILVVVDWSRQPWRAGATEGCVRSFNPCCGGLVASTVPRVRRTWFTRCFNPCCGGLVASTLDADAGPGPAAGFQSLLWWIGRVNCGTWASGSPRRWPFQSLLWWIGRVNSGRADPQPREHAGFNPCCGGLVASTSTISPGDCP